MKKAVAIALTASVATLMLPVSALAAPIYITVDIEATGFGTTTSFVFCDRAAVTPCSIISNIDRNVPISFRTVVNLAERGTPVNYYRSNAPNVYPSYTQVSGSITSDLSGALIGSNLSYDRLIFDDLLDCRSGEAACSRTEQHLYASTFRVTVPVPEPATWVMMVLGFGVVGYSLRKRQAVKTAVRFA
ncbi:PEPxxWA-CTERM sorting domain-containing protein [Sphingomonas sp. RRHST34]|uniref:PEPxxWA-CTERM sorting domain-containing protein n=1 Tax=Sphingomonas citri TaxID=2862499 RepID=A0ABS7BMB6_9SPHN|nr:PEPxxWA-CTERM sorting domain-containing protein [Sphingomonas citri]MBW6530740.1 PEPxxWA-CTERM sorting domain-containing protein [Sphingomonas citri]